MSPPARPDRSRPLPETGGSRNARLTLPGRARQAWVWFTGTGTAVSAGLAVLVFACVFMAVAGPRAALGLRTRALQRAVAATPVLGRSVAGSIDYSGFITLLHGGFNASGIRLAYFSLLDYLRTDRLPLGPEGQDWAGMSTQLQPVAGAPPKATIGLPPRFELVYRENLDEYSRLVAGRLPDRSTAGARGSRFEVAVTQATAGRLGLHLGSELRTEGSTTLVVTGIIRPLSPGSAFWAADRTIFAPVTQAAGGGDAPEFLAGAAIVGADELPDVPRAYPIADIQLAWDFPLQLSGVSASQAGPLQAALSRMHAHQGQVAFRGETAALEPVSLTSGIGPQLGGFLQQDQAVSSVLYSLFASLAVVAALAVLLCCWLLAEYRRAEFAVLRARGASAVQHALLALRAAAAATLPGAVLGAAAAVLATPGPAAPTGYWLAGLAVLAGLLTPPLIALRWRRTSRPDPSRATRPGWRILTGQAATRRLMTELALLAASAGGLALLRRQGTAAGHPDWYTSLAPTLVAIPAAIVVLRCYPLALRGLQQLTAARPGVAAFVGVARAARTSLRAALPVFALVLTLTVVAFGAAVHTAIHRGEVSASWRQTGADAIVRLTQDLATLAPAERQISSAPGVLHAAPVSIQTGATSIGFGLTIVIVDPAQYAALIADTPAPAFPATLLRQPATGSGRAATAVPVLVSAPAMRLIKPGASALQVGVRRLLVHPAGRAPAIPGVTAQSVMVLPSWAFGSHQPQPTQLLLTGPHINGRALTALVRRLLPSATVTLRSSALAALTGAPLPRAGVLAFAAGAIAAAILSTVVLLLTLLLGARSRELTLTRLRVIGLAPRQAGWLTATEALPQVAAAAIAGTAAAVVLSALIGPALNLSPFTGSTAAVPLRADPAALGGAAAALLIIALLALLAENGIGKLRSPAAVLRAPGSDELEAIR